jgi:hypothetical protein
VALATLRSVPVFVIVSGAAAAAVNPLVSNVTAPVSAAAPLPSPISDAALASTLSVVV